MTNVEQQARDLVENVSKQIKEAREKLAKEMIEKEMYDNLWGIADNLSVVIDDPTVPYNCWPILLTKPRMNRGNT